MFGNITVSIIIAAYNAEKYLKETMDSVTLQSQKNYEVIVVNDGSTDGTAAILKEYANKYENVTVLEKENEGPSSARNLGLEYAKGEYIYFFDADDVLEFDALEALYERAISCDADIVIAKYDIFDRNGITKVNSINDLVVLDNIERYDTTILWTFSLCNKLFRKNLVDRFNIKFPPISYSEDGVFTMTCVYNSKIIVGLDKVIFHYRRMFDGETTSITSTISSKKINDYITAHRIIYSIAQEKILKDFNQYESLEDAKENNKDIQKYLNEIILKELQILLNQFYVKFWSTDEDTIQLIVNEIKEKLHLLNAQSIFKLVDSHPELPLFQLPFKKQEMLEKAFITVVLYGNKSDESEFIRCLDSIISQKLVAVKIVVPDHMRAIIQKKYTMQGNIIFLDAKSQDMLFDKALLLTDTEYIMFADLNFVYANYALSKMVSYFAKSVVDFVIELIYHREYGEKMPVYINNIVYNRYFLGIRRDSYLCMDNTFANKFFRSSYIKKIRTRNYGTWLDMLPSLYKTGYHAFLNSGSVIYEETEESYFNKFVPEDRKAFVKDFLKEKPADLQNKELEVTEKDFYRKAIMLSRETTIDILFKKTVTFFSLQPCRNQVLFFSVRKDGELEGNAKALYPHIKGKKVICAKMLPHDKITQLKMFYHILTSKVIITDDYIKYLRYVKLKPEQKVIQLWHACGAFKKFGRRGTNISISTDIATHSQYNLVTVSADNIRKIYADAFDVDINKVSALGCARTDDFFNESLIESRKRKVYEKHPEFENKYVIIYAPTFREINNDRTKFEPEIDFDRLSERLLPNQVFLICPHPLMKNSIIPKSYDNIKVIRDFSTNDMMYISNMLITDYSSVIFEYTLLRKPIIFYCYDLSIYNRGFYLRYPDDLPGEVYETQNDLEEYLTDTKKHILTPKYHDFVQKYMSACDGHSCERIAHIINSYMEGKNV